MMAYLLTGFAFITALLGLHLGVRALLSILEIEPYEGTEYLEAIAARSIFSMNIVTLFTSVATVAWRLGGLE